MAFRRSHAAAAAAAAALGGCGPRPSTSSPAAGHLPVVITEFDDWCANWGLHCPAGMAPNVPSKDKPWTPAQWSDLHAGLKAVQDAPMDVVVTRAELTDPRLARVFSLLGAGDLLQKLQQKIAGAGFQKLRVNGGQLTFSSDRPSEITGQSGLKLKTDPETSLKIDAAGNVVATGVHLGGPAGGTDTLRGYSVTDTNLLAWKGDGGHEYDDVPIKYLLDEVLGLDVGGDSAPAPKKKYQDILPALLPMRDWLTSGQREVTLPQTTFAALAEHMPKLAADEQHGKGMAYVLSRIVKVESTGAVRGDHLIQGEATKEIRCAIGRKATLMVDTHFSIDGMTELDGGGVRIHMTGVSAKPMTGLIRPTIDLKTLDLETDSITVHNVPVIGTYSIDMNDPDSENMKIHCGEDVL